MGSRSGGPRTQLRRQHEELLVSQNLRRSMMVLSSRRELRGALAIVENEVSSNHHEQIRIVVFRILHSCSSSLRWCICGYCAAQRVHPEG
jgi:hypothetical protein